MTLINVIFPGDSKFSNDHNPASFGPYDQIWSHVCDGDFHGEDQPLVQVQQNLPVVRSGQDATHRLGGGNWFGGTLFDEGNTSGSGITGERQGIELIYRFLHKLSNDC